MLTTTRLQGKPACAYPFGNTSGCPWWNMDIMDRGPRGGRSRDSQPTGCTEISHWVAIPLHQSPSGNKGFYLLIRPNQASASSSGSSLETSTSSCKCRMFTCSSRRLFWSRSNLRVRTSSFLESCLGVIAIFQSKIHVQLLLGIQPIGDRLRGYTQTMSSLQWQRKEFLFHLLRRPHS